MNKFNHIKNHCNFWVIQFTLFISVFAFTGYNAKAELPISDSAQTELVLAKKKVSTKVISLKKAIATFSVCCSLPKQFRFQKVELLNYHHLLIVKLKAVFLKYISYPKPNFLFLKRNIAASLEIELPAFSIL